MSSTKELKLGTILSYAQMILGVLISMAYTPVMIRLLGKSEYGLYNTVSSTISMLSVLSLGFNSSYVRYLARYKKNDEKDKINALNGLFLTVFCVIGTVALICGLFLTTHLDLVFKDGLTSGEYDIAKTLMLLLTINLTISFPMSVFSTIISANERFVFLKLMGMVKTVVSPLVNLPLLLLGFRSVGLVVSALVFHIITDIIYVYYVLAKLNNRFAFCKVEKGLFGEIFTFTVFIAINEIVNQINNNIDRVLLGRFNGTGAVAVYAVGANLYAHYVHLSTAVSGVFTPRIHKLYNEKKETVSRNIAITDLFIRVGRIQYLILALIASGLLFFGKQFVIFWAGREYGAESYYVSLLLILPATIPLIQNLGIEIQRAANKHRFRSIAYFIMAIANLLLTIYLCPKYGAVGASVGTAISLIVANGLIMNIYYKTNLGIDIPKFWNNIFRMTLGMLPAFAVGVVIWRFVVYSKVWEMLLLILIYSFVYLISVWLFSMNHVERDMVLSPLRKISKKFIKT